MTGSTNRRAIGMVIASIVMVLLHTPARADDAAAKLYQSKCAVCHGADGIGNTTLGKALKIKDLHDPEVQNMTDAELTTIITKGKDKMPAYEKALKADEIKGLVAYVRELAKKK